MLQSKTKLLVSGCGLTFSSSECGKTYANILKLTGLDVIDVSGPAVSNQWIINRAFLKLVEDTEIKRAVIQLTSLGKLDVYVDKQRIDELVTPDRLRNFVVDNVWPSSASLDHKSKQLWQQYLFSPELEQQDLVVKLLLLQNYCDTHGIELLVIQGYDLEWTAQQKELINGTINDVNYNIITDYGIPLKEKEVPAMDFQFKLANTVISTLAKDKLDQLLKIEQQYINRYRH